MYHIVLYLCTIIKCKDSVSYFSCVVYVGLKISMDARKIFVGSLCRYTFIVITAGMLLWECSLWSLLLSLPDMSQFNINTHYVCSYVATGYHSSLCYFVTRSPRCFEESKFCLRMYQWIASSDGCIQFTETLRKFAR